MEEPEEQDASPYQEGLASIFADNQDLERYKAAIAKGATEQQALSVGDNGVGAWNDDTTNPNDPIVALPTDTPGFGYNRKVLVEGPNGSVVARIADKMGHIGKASIDLNPAAAAAIGHNGGLSPVKWKFIDDNAAPASSSNVFGDLSNVALPQPDGLGGITGVHRLTPIGEPGASEIVDESLSDDDGLTLGNASVNQGLEDAQVPTDEPQQAPEAAGGPLPPDPKGYRYNGMNPDGSKRLVNGANRIDVYPDNSTIYNQGGYKWIHIDGKEPQRLPDKPLSPHDVMIKNAAQKGILREQFPLGADGDRAFMEAARTGLTGQQGTVHPGIMNKLIEYGAPLTNPDGSPLKNDSEAAAVLQNYQKTNNIPTKAQQHIADVIVGKVASSRNPYTKNYLAVQGNYESAIENISKPDRNGVDDVFLLSAVAGIENPGRSNTENDFKLALKSAGIRGNLEVMAKRAKSLFDGNTEDQGRILPDEMLPQLKVAVMNAVKARYNQYKTGIEPFRKQLTKAGLNPDDYLPDIKLEGSQPQQQSPTTPSAAAVDQNSIYQEATRRLQANPSDETAKAALDKLKRIGFTPNG